MGSCCGGSGKTGGMRFKLRLSKAIQEFKKELKGQEVQDPRRKETIEFVREKSFLKAKPVIDHLELRGLDGSKVGNELVRLYYSNKNVVIKALIIGIIWICMDKCNKKIGGITKNMLASQADTDITEVILHSLDNHYEYEHVIILTFDCLIAYLDTCRVYKQGIFEEENLLDRCKRFTNSTQSVLISCNKAISRLVLYSSFEAVEKRQTDLVNYVFHVTKSNKDNIENQNISRSEPVPDMTSEEEILVNSTLEILNSIATKVEPLGKEKKEFISLLMQNFEDEKWKSPKYISSIIINTTAKRNGDEAIVQNDTLTQILNYLYQIIIERTEPLLENTNGRSLTEEELVSITKILFELYPLRPESHAYAIGSPEIFKVFMNLCQVEPMVGKEDNYDYVVNAFGSYMDNLMFRYSPNDQEETHEIPSARNRFKATHALIRYGEENEIYEEIFEGSNPSNIKKDQIQGSVNFIRLIQTAVSVLYDSATELNKTEELHTISGKAMSFTDKDFNTLLNPIIRVIEDSPDEMNEEISDLLIDCVIKMLKYEQMFSPSHSRIFIHVLKALPLAAPCQSENFPLAFAVFINLVANNPKTPVGPLIPKFIKSFNSELQNSQVGSERERNAYRASTTLKFAEIAASITQDSGLASLARDEANNAGNDSDSAETGWINSFISKFSSEWNKYLGDSHVNVDDISLEEDQSREEINQHDQSKDKIPNSLLKALVQKMEKTDVGSGQQSQTPSASIAESSKFSLDDATFKNDDSEFDESASAQSLMQYIRNVS
ncbi:unnamed protein product [Moneuplotes crassus]|uniref:Uncharacterized protein n=1 Tax=Euplotes crassus TaxID=5936 RepID=A0AAD2DBY6_EUPCR|nr:unnamed protein product [Moneuplotes crassus]